MALKKSASSEFLHLQLFQQEVCIEFFLEELSNIV